MKHHPDAADNLDFIRKTIEAAGTYTNLPAGADISAGIISLAGCAVTFQRLGTDKLSNINAIALTDVRFLALVWSLVLVLSATVAVALSIRAARKNHLPAWTSLASRLFLSQIPTVFVAGVLTVALTARGMYEVIPAVWLLGYGVIAFSFSYFTGSEHRIQSSIFLSLGTVATFANGSQGLLLLAVGFGALHLICGLMRLLKSRGGPWNPRN
jgi:hypothetical protein